MMRHEVVAPKAYHVGQIARSLRREHAESMRATGLDPHQVIRGAFIQSSYCRSGLIDGRLAAMWGVTGTLLGGGIVWMVIAEWATAYPMILLRETRRQLAIMTAARGSLESGIIIGDRAAWRFASRLGFFLKHPGGADSLSQQTTPLECILAAAPEYRVDLPTGVSGVLVGYQGALHG